MKALLLKSWALIYPPTKARLHRLVSFVGTAFAVFAIFELWYARLGISTTGKIGSTLGMLATYAASWAAIRPKIDQTIDGLPIPEGSTVTQTETASKTTTITPPGPSAPAVPATAASEAVTTNITPPKT